LSVYAKDLFVGAKQAGRTTPPPIPHQPGSAVEMQHDVKIVGHGSDEQMFGAK
jgi:hypothetical protein